MKLIDNDTEPFFNIVKFANDLELWERRKKKICDEVEKDLKRKEFIEKHLLENFKYLIPNKNLLDSMSNLIGYKLCNDFQSQNFKFIINFVFTDRKIYNEKDIEFEVKLKDIATNCKVVNKKELKNIFQKLLYRIGYEIGFTQGMIDRIDIDIMILRNEKEKLFIKENIINDLPDKTKYETILNRVKNDIKKNSELHLLEKYIKNRFNLNNDPEYICFLRKELGHKNISYSALEKSLDRYRKR